MKKYLLILCLLGALPSFGQHWGLGLRLGDPTGITAKRYMAKSAFEFNLGRSNSWYHPGWHHNHFDPWYRDRYPDYPDYDYINYSRAHNFTFQAHYLLRRTSFFKKTVPGLEWYFGFGGQIRARSYFYSYRYRVPGEPDWRYVYDERVTDLDVGVDGVLGIEYGFQEIPLSVFADITLFLEVVDDPFFFWPQNGVGVRYNFK